MPAGLPLTAEDINEDLKRRQGGYGRGGRMKIESDQVIFTSGVRHGRTTGAPITMDVVNKDHQKWLDIMSAEDWVMPAGIRPFSSATLEICTIPMATASPCMTFP